MICTVLTPDLWGLDVHDEFGPEDKPRAVLKRDDYWR